MARTKKAKEPTIGERELQIARQLIERRDPPPKGQTPDSWWSLLMAVREQPGNWFMVRQFETIKQANNAAGNLSNRQIKIPDPTADWGFSARGGEVFAIYRPGVDQIQAQVVRTREAKAAKEKAKEARKASRPTPSAAKKNGAGRGTSSVRRTKRQG